MEITIRHSTYHICKLLLLLLDRFYKYSFFILFFTSDRNKKKYDALKAFALIGGIHDTLLFVSLYLPEVL